MFSDEVKAHLLAVFRGEIVGETVCEDCGGLHKRACPRVKRRAFHANGNLIEVEYWPEEMYRDAVLWPEDLFNEDDNA